MLHVLLVAFLNLFHPFYVSVTEIKQDVKSKTMQVSVRVFFDDFELALNKKYKTKVNILKPEDRKVLDGFIADYMNAHLKIKTSQKLLSLKYVGYEIEEDAAWCYFETESAGQINQLTVQNSILFEQHESQSNMLHVIVNGKRKSTKLDNPKNQATFSF